MKKAIFIFWLCFLCIPLAHAHPPYLVKEGVVTTSTGETIIKELLYGDGLIAQDPSSFQLRHSNGAVIANAPTGDYVESFCPSLTFCWVFSYNNPFGLTVGWRLDHDKLNLNPEPPQYDFTRSEDAKEFEEYLNSSENRHASSYPFGYPELSDDFKGFNKSYISTLISPIIILLNRPITFFTFFALTIFVIRVYKKVSSIKWSKKEHKTSLLLVLKILRIAFVLLGFVIILAWFFMMILFLSGYLTPIGVACISAVYYEKRKES